MFSFLCNSKCIFRKWGLLNLKFNGRDSTTTSTTIPPLFLLRPISILSTTNDSVDHNDSFTISYLINSCGLSQPQAITASKRLQLKSPSNPDSVLTLLRNYGFADTHISNFVFRRPALLVADPNKTLKPKIEFFQSIGLCGTQLADFLSDYPTILAHSLDKHIIPSIAFLKTILHTDTNLFKVLKRNKWILDKDLQKHLAPKIALLQAHGLPNSSISSLLTIHSRVFLQISVDRFDEAVRQLKEMGFDPSECGFVYAIRALTGLSKSVWEGKLNAYRRCGWSEEDFRTAFMKQPGCMITSEKKILHIMDVLVNKMGYGPSLIAQHPNVFLLSLKERIIPRYSVLQVLIAKGLVKKDQTIYMVFQSPENDFLKKFVTEFESKVPKLLDVYRGKVNALELLC